MMQASAKENGWTKFVSMQNHYSMLYREEEREMNKFCKETGVGLVPVSLRRLHRRLPSRTNEEIADLVKWSPLARGHLARPRSDMKQSVRGAGEAEKPLFPSIAGQQDEEIIDRVQELAEKKGWSMSQVALAWTNKRVTSPIVGFSSVQRLDEVINARGKALDEEEEKYLEELYVPKAIQGHM